MARILIQNLIPGKEYAVVFRAEGPSAVGQWSQPISFTAPQATDIPIDSEYDVRVRGSISVKSDETSPPAYRDDKTSFYVDSDGYLSIKNLLYFNPTDTSLTVTGSVNAFAGNFVNTLNVGTGSATVNTSASVASGQSTIPMSSTTSISIGGTVSGTSIAASTTVVGKDSQNIYINKNTTGSIASATPLTFASASGLLAVGSNSNSRINILGTDTASTTKIYSTVGGVETTASSGTGFYLDASGSLNIGNKLKWNGTSLTVDGSGSFSGSISATSGSIGGFSIGTSALTASNIVLSSSAGFALGSASQFRVTQAGDLNATSASISGSIVASSGSITGDLNISSAGRLIAGTIGASAVIVAGAGITGTYLGIPVFTLPTDGTAPTIGAFRVVQTGLQAIGQVTVAASTVSGSSTARVTASSASLLWTGMSANGGGFASGTTITSINTTTGAIGLSIAASATNSGFTASMIPNANMIIGVSASDNITIRGQQSPGGPAAIFTTIGNVATTQSSGTGFYLDSTGSLNIGNKLKWNGTTLSVDGSGSFSGSISASSGSVGGWLIGTANLTSTSSNVVLSNSGSITAGTSTSKINIVGAATGAGTKIYTTIAGTDTTATTGAGFYFDASGSVNIGSKLKWDGATLSVDGSGSFSGSISASSGSIGGWTISSGSLSAGTGASVVGIAPSTYAFWAGNSTPSSASFYVTNTGSLVASNATVRGTINDLTVALKFTNNTAIGDTALSSLTSSGTYNVGVGSSALYSVTGGDHNVAVGYQAMLSSASATNNIAIGASAMRSSSGVFLQDNIGIGGQALQFTQGGGNIGIGTQAGQYIKGLGSGNIAIGTSAIRSASTGSGDNIGIGRSSTGGGNSGLGSGVTGTSNIGLGLSSLNVVTSGSNNVAIGESAGYLISTGRNNVGIGYFALQNVTTGSYNTAIGSAASTIGPTSNLSGTVAIGVDSSGNGASATANNQFTLGTASHDIRILGTASIVGTASVTGSARFAAAVLMNSTASVTGDFTASAGNNYLGSIQSGVWSASTIDAINSSSTLGGAVIRSQSNSSATYSFNAVITSSAYVGDVYGARVTRPSSSAFNFFLFYASVTNDAKARLDGTGKLFLDNTVIGTPADYAEYFEWSDGNPNNENRIGYSVVIDQDAKITFATENSSSIIGIISAVPAFVADSAWNGWKNKYLYTDLGEPIYEEYVLEDGTVDFIKKINPEYDPLLEYVPRSERPEWDAVGMVGKLRLRKGQPVNPNWIKMRDISDSVEEWLVR